jgi:predicted DNA-binding transcriptional regulator AlpA
MRIKELASWLGCSERTISRSVKRGHLPPPFRIGDSWYWDPDLVRKHLTERQGIKPRKGRLASRPIPAKECEHVANTG